MRVTVEPYGPAAFETLARTVAEAQDGDPLGRVNVVVARGSVGLVARRRLAAAAPGLGNVRFLTFPGLAGELASGWVAATARRPLSRAALHEAVRMVLAGVDGGLLGPARDQPATVRALAQTYRELRGVPAPALRTLSARNDICAEVVRLVEAISGQLADWYDDDDVVAAAAAQLAPDAVTGPLIVHLPTRLGPGERRLLEVLDSRGPVTVIIGSTGDPVADEPARALVVALGEVPTGFPESIAVVRGSRTLAAPTADAEVLLVLRQVMARLEAGARLERLAVAHSGCAPYPGLIHDALGSAGIPFNGPGVRPLAATVPGRTLLGVLGLGDHDWRRDDVMGWLTSAPLLDGRRRPVPGNGWDELSCRAGVVSGLAEWQDRPTAHAAALRARADSTSGDERAAWLRDAERCEALSAFVTDLARRLAEAQGTWAAFAEWARQLLRDLLGETAQHAAWPDAEVLALDAVMEILQGLSALADRRPSLGEFRAALTAELELPAPQPSRFGQGVFVGRVADVVGLDFDALWVVGMIDGAFPGRAQDDVLVPDRERDASGGEIPLRGARRAEERRDYLAALAAAPDRRLSYATGDQRHGRDQRPAQLFLDTLASLVGSDRRLFAGDLERIEPGPDHVVVPSFAAAVADRSGEPTSAADWDLRSLLGWREAGGDLAGHSLSRSDPVLRRGLELVRGRSRSTFSRFDGRVEQLAVPSPAAGADAHPVVQSPTRLETYARCPRSYFFRTLLGIEVRDPPEAIVRIGPLERGNVVHRILERFVGDTLSSGPIDPETPWGADGEERLHRIADEVFADFERRGLTGRDAMWQIDRAVILGELRHFLREDDRYRRETRAVPEAVEQAFGHGGEPAVSVELGGGRSLGFRGTIDRIDRTADGGLSVLDYKTGRRRSPDEDPVARGTRLQLPMYGLAARQRYRPEGTIDVRYWFVSDRGSERGSYPRDGFTLTEDVEARFVGVVGTLVESIEGGRFPGNPAGCVICPYDHICPPDRARSWERKRSDGWIADYLALAEPS